METAAYSKFIRQCLAALLLLLPSAVMANTDKLEYLEKKLHERNKVIIELLQRVKALERRVGLSGTSSVIVENHEPQQLNPPVVNNVNEAGALVVDEISAERALERSLTNEGALLLPKGYFELEPGLSFSRTEDSTPYLLSAGGNIFAGRTERSSNALKADIGLRLGLPWDSQLEAGLPYHWKNIESTQSVNFLPSASSSQTGSALGDFRVGFAKTLLREDLWYPDLVARVTWDSDSGDIFDDGVSLGGGFHELRGSLTAIKRQDPIAFVGGLSYEHSFEQSRIQPGPVISANLGSFIALSPETSLRITFLGAYQSETELAGNEIPGSDQTLASLIFGTSTLLAPGTLLNVSAGIGLTEDSDDFTLSVSLPIRFSEPLY